MEAPWRVKDGTGAGSLPWWATGSTGCLASQFCLCVSLFLVEVVASRTTGSLLVLSCSFHTLGGVLALGVSLTEAWLAAGGSPGRRNTFGWARAQVLGTLISALLLSALCLALVPEALRRVVDPQVTEHALALMGIGAVGIPVHLAGAGLHGRHRQDPETRPCCSRRRDVQAGSSAHEMEDLLGNGSSTNGQSWMEEEENGDDSPASPLEKPGPWRALCLGWTVACLGPVALLTYSLIFRLLWVPCLGHAACLSHCLRSVCWAWDVPTWPRHEQSPCWLLYLDPALAMAVAVSLLFLVWPALHRSATVLLQAIPAELNLQLLERHLRDTEGVAAVHELHVWQLDGPTSLVATVHVRCLDVEAYRAVTERVRQVFCDHGIHAATVQPDLGGCQAGKRHEEWRQAHKRRLATVTEYESSV